MGRRLKTRQRVKMEENMKYLVEEERTQTKRVYFSKGRED
jgi:hypothetical protein